MHPDGAKQHTMKRISLFVSGLKGKAASSLTDSFSPESFRNVQIFQPKAGDYAVVNCEAELKDFQTTLSEFKSTKEWITTSVSETLGELKPKLGKVEVDINSGIITNEMSKEANKSDVASHAPHHAAAASYITASFASKLGDSIKQTIIVIHKRVSILGRVRKVALFNEVMQEGDVIIRASRRGLFNRMFRVQYESSTLAPSALGEFFSSVSSILNWLSKALSLVACVQMADEIKSTVNLCHVLEEIQASLPVMVEKLHRCAGREHKVAEKLAQHCHLWLTSKIVELGAALTELNSNRCSGGFEKTILASLILGTGLLIGSAGLDLAFCILDFARVFVQIFIHLLYYAGRRSFSKCLDICSDFSILQKRLSRQASVNDILRAFPSKVDSLLKTVDKDAVMDAIEWKSLKDTFNKMKESFMWGWANPTQALELVAGKIKSGAQFMWDTVVDTSNKVAHAVSHPAQTAENLMEVLRPAWEATASGFNYVMNNKVETMKAVAVAPVVVVAAVGVAVATVLGGLFSVAFWGFKRLSNF